MQLPESRVLFSAAEIDAAAQRVAAEVARHCGEQEWVVLTVLQGGMMFAAKLLELLPMPLSVDCVRTSRYGDATRGGELHWLYEPTLSLADRRVLLVDDIFDEGETLAALLAYCQQRGALEVRSAVLLDKQHGRKATLQRPDFTGLTCGDDYVFGFGMDYQGYWRNLPDIRALTADP